MGCCAGRPSGAHGQLPDFQQHLARSEFKPRSQDVRVCTDWPRLSSSAAEYHAARERQSLGRCHGSGLAAASAPLCHAAHEVAGVCVLLANHWILSITRCMTAASTHLCHAADVVAGFSVLLVNRWILSIMLFVSPLRFHKRRANLSSKSSWFRLECRSGIVTKLPSGVEERTHRINSGEKDPTSRKHGQNTASMSLDATDAGSASEEVRSGIAPVSVSIQISEASELAAETLILSDVLAVLEILPPLLQILPGMSVLSFTYKSQVARVRASPDMSCTVKEALENERTRGAHEDCIPEGQMSSRSVACDLYWTILAISWCLRTIEGVRDGLFFGVAAGNAYPDTFESHHGFWLRKAFRTAFLLAPKTDGAQVKEIFEGLDIPVVRRLCEKLDACFHEVGLFDTRKV